MPGTGLPMVIGLPGSMRPRKEVIFAQPVGP